MILQKRNYDEFKSANKENLNSSNFLNPLNISERKQKKNNLLEFNINYAFNNKLNYNILNSNDINIINNNDSNSMELSSFHILK